LRFLGKHYLNFINDVRQLYEIVRKQEYEAQGKRLPLSELLTLGEQQILASYLQQVANCLKSPLRSNIHLFNIDSSMSLKETIYHAFIQGKNRINPSVFVKVQIKRVKLISGISGVPESFLPLVNIQTD
jgi:hypothetical protein